MFKYETHLHTSPVSKCAKASVRDSLTFYRSLGYDGVFITNHFVDGNVAIDSSRPYEERIQYYFSDYEEGLRLAPEIGIRVFLGIELSYAGTDFLCWGLGKEWFLAHPEILDMKRSDELRYLREAGALIVHAHPFREAGYIDHIRLFPRCVQGVETINANRTDFENDMAERYAQAYGLCRTAGSDNHVGAEQKKLAGMMSEKPLRDEKDFMERVLNGDMQIFSTTLA